MANLPIAVIGDSVSTHYANDTPPYFVTQTRIIGAPGPAAARGAKGFFSGSLDVFADSRPVHRVSDIVGQPHFSNATPIDIPPSGGYVPCETISTLGFAAVYNFHHQPYLAEGSPTVFVNGKSVLLALKRCKQTYYNSSVHGKSVELITSTVSYISP